MLFEYDPVKSAKNRAKHGIDFERAKRLWENPTVRVPSRGEYGEVRYAVFGMIDDKHWTAIVTYRYESTRIISVRRSRTKEAAYYDEQTNQH